MQYRSDYHLNPELKVKPISKIDKIEASSIFTQKPIDHQLPGLRYSLKLVSISDKQPKQLNSPTTRKRKLEGWGSIESRKSYACLKTLAGQFNDEDKPLSPKTHTSQSIEQDKNDEWGQFVDDDDCWPTSNQDFNIF